MVLPPAPFKKWRTCPRCLPASKKSPQNPSISLALRPETIRHPDKRSKLENGATCGLGIPGPSPLACGEPYATMATPSQRAMQASRPTHRSPSGVGAIFSIMQFSVASSFSPEGSWLRKTLLNRLIISAGYSDFSSGQVTTAGSGVLVLDLSYRPFRKSSCSFSGTYQIKPVKN